MASPLDRRLDNLQLRATTRTTPEEVVAWLGAVQAQDYAGALWAVGLRARAITEADVERAFAEGRILRTHVLRPTWHFVTPNDIRWMLDLSRPRLKVQLRSYDRWHELDARTIARARGLVERALEGGRHLTRPELSEVLARGRIDATGQRLAHLLMHAEFEGAICSGPRRGKQFTYALLAERAPRAHTLPREEALAELATRYFRSHGPATLRDFAWWSGLTMADARAATPTLGDAVLDVEPPPQRVAGAHFLLPNFDEYLVAYKGRAAVIDPARMRNLGVYTSDGHPHAVILDGRLAGGWQRAITSESLRVTVRLFEPATRAHARALEVETARYGRFLGLPHRLEH